jgi:hypothetical protein
MNSSIIRVGLLFLLAAGVGGCGRSGFHSPTIDVVGSYFPAWMICIIIGLTLTLIARLVLVALKLEAHVRPGAIVYPCLITVFTLAVWLVFFQN